MKKIFTLAALAAICFASCSKNEVIVPQTEANAINFGTYVGNAPVVKSQDITSDNLTGLYVSAYYTGTESWNDNATDQPGFMKDEALTKSSDVWSYQNIKYWPANKDAKFTFIAVAPKEDAFKWPSNGNILTFNVEEEAANQRDLMWDVVSNTSQNESATQAGQANYVKFEMEHMLSKLDIKVKLAAAYDDMTIDVTEVTIGGTSAGSGFATACEFDLLKGSVNPNTATNRAYTFSADVNALSSTTQLTESTATTAVQINAESLILVPQALTDVPVSIRYNTTDAKGNVISNHKAGTVNMTLAQKTQYSLVITITMDAIQFSVMYADWTPGNDITWNTTEATVTE